MPASTAVLELVLVVLEKEIDKHPFHRVPVHVEETFPAGVNASSKGAELRAPFFSYDIQYVPGCRTRRRWRGRDRRSSLGVAVPSCSPLCNGQNCDLRPPTLLERLSQSLHPILPFRLDLRFVRTFCFPPLHGRSAQSARSTFFPTRNSPAPCVFFFLIRALRAGRPLDTCRLNIVSCSSITDYRNRPISRT